MVGMGKIAGIVLIALGIIGFLVAALWGALNVGSGDLQATGLVFCLGPALLVLALMVGVGIFLILLRKMDTQGKLPFGVFLGIASALCLFYGFSVARWYMDIPQ